MKKWLSLYICGLLSTMIITVQKVHAQRQNVTITSPGINFKTEKWHNILAMAKRQHKQIFVDAYAIWCAPCKQLKAQTFKDKKVADYFNREFINVSIDIEKGDGLVFADEFDISAYPTLLWLDENGKLIKRSEGFMNAQQLLAMAKHEEKLN